MNEYNDAEYVYDEESASDLPKIQEWASSIWRTVGDINDTDLELNLTLNLRRNWLLNAIPIVHFQT